MILEASHRRLNRHLLISPVDCSVGGPPGRRDPDRRQILYTGADESCIIGHIEHISLPGSPVLTRLHLTPPPGDRPQGKNKPITSHVRRPHLDLGTRVFRRHLSYNSGCHPDKFGILGRVARYQSNLPSKPFRGRLFMTVRDQCRRARAGRLCGHVRMRMVRPRFICRHHGSYVIGYRRHTAT